MRIACDRAALLAAAEIVARSVAPKSVGGLECARLVGGRGRLEISGTDTIMQAHGALPAAVSEPGGVLVNAATLVDAVAGMPKGTVDIRTTEAHGIQVRGGKRTMDLPGRSIDDFPQLEAHPGSWRSIQRETLVALLKRTSYAMASDAAKDFLAGVKLVTEEGELLAIATDGNRMAVARTASDLQALDIMVPARLVDELEKVLAASAEPIVEFAASAHSIYFRFGSTTLGSQLKIAGGFPPWRDVLPSGSVACQARVARDALTESVRAVSRLSPDRTAGIGVALRPGEVEVRSNDPGRGSGKDLVDAEVEGDEVVFGINAKYLLDALAATDDEDVFVESNGPDSAVVFRPAEVQGQLCLVMPARLP
jgi:DNA polymerase-3 subunit beta